MAKTEEIYSMFGLKSPTQIRNERIARESAFMRAQQDPFSKAGAAIGLGLGRLFGGPSEEELQAQEAEKVMQEAMGAGDGEIAKMAAMANRFSEMGMPQAALGALARLNELKQAEKDRRALEAKSARDIADFERDRYQQYQETRRVQVGVDATGTPIMGSQTFTYLRDKDNPDAPPRLLAVSDDTGAGGSVDPNAPVPVTGPIVRTRSGATLEKAPDGNYYLVVTGTEGTFRGAMVSDPRLVEEETATGGRGDVVGATPSTRGQMGRNNTARTVTAPQQTNIPSGQARRQRREQR